MVEPASVPKVNIEDLRSAISTEYRDVADHLTKERGEGNKSLFRSVILQTSVLLP